MRNKRVLLIFSGELFQLVPGLSIVEALQNKYDLSVLSYEKEMNSLNLRNKYPNVNFISKQIRPESESFLDKVIRHLFHTKFHREVCKVLKTAKYDLIWILHEKTLYEFQDSLLEQEYIVSIYELNDHDWNFVQSIQKGVRNAKKVIACEYNRSCIMRVWYNLDYTPLVVPNKPYSHPMNKNIPCEYADKLKGKKIIIYQGHIQRVRNLDKLCEAVKYFPEYTLVLMGGGQEEYINELKEKYQNVLFLGFVKPPHHLEITSYARIGVVKYDHIYLNHTFCAPNKIWEYSGFGIPTLGNDLPGLENTIGQAGAGLCVNFDDVEAIKNGISRIENNYNEFSENAQKFYNSVDLYNLLSTIAETSMK